MSIALSLAEAKTLFLDKSSKTIHEILEKEKYNLRNRSSRRPPPMTWLDTDDSEDYAPTGSSVAMTGKSTPAAGKNNKKRKARSSEETAGETAAKKAKTLNAFLDSSPADLGDREEEDKMETMEDVGKDEGGVNGGDFAVSGCKQSPEVEHSAPEGTRDEGEDGDTDEQNLAFTDSLPVFRGGVEEDKMDETLDDVDKDVEATDGEQPALVDGSASPGSQQAVAKGTGNTNEEGKKEISKRVGGIGEMNHEFLASFPVYLVDEEEDRKEFTNKDWGNDSGSTIENDLTVTGCSAPAQDAQAVAKGTSGTKKEGKGEVDEEEGGVYEEKAEVAGSSTLARGENTDQCANPKPSDTIDTASKDCIERQRTPTPAPREEDGEVTTPVVNPRANLEEAVMPRTLEISTCFAHPMIFDHIPNEEGSDPCHFCSDFAYGIVGLGKRTVEVVDLGDRLYEEIRNGHSQEGSQPSRMCINCAQRRLRILRCPGHRTLPIQGISPESFNFNAAYDSLIPVMGQKRTAKNSWCSLCPTPAFFQCRCGLMLCEECEIMARALGGVFSKVVMKIEENDQDGTRADVEFILPDSQLEKQNTK